MGNIEKARKLADRLNTYGLPRPLEFEVSEAQLNATIAVHDKLAEIASLLKGQNHVEDAHDYGPVEAWNGGRPLPKVDGDE